MNALSTRSPEAFPALVLNADYTPLNYYPLSLWHWQTAIKAVFLDRVNIVAEYDKEVRSPTQNFRLPSVISLRNYVKPEPYPAFTRFNVFLRDKFECQYCGSGSHTGSDLTFDHLVPRCEKGLTRWDNIVTACGPCNLKKGSKSLKQSGMNLKRMPHRPTVYELHTNGRQFPPNYLHDSWMDFLYWDSELDE